MKPLFDFKNFQQTKSYWDNPGNFGMHCDTEKKQIVFLKEWNKATGANSWKSGSKFITNDGCTSNLPSYKNCVIWTSGQYGDFMNHQKDKDRIFEFDDYHWEEIDGAWEKPEISTASLF